MSSRTSHSCETCRRWADTSVSDIQIDDTKTYAYVIKRRMHRFLIDSITFLYELDPIALKSALSSHPPVPEDDSTPFKPHQWSILPQEDREINILNLAKTVANNNLQVTKQQISSITATDIEFVHTNVIIPAQQLRVHPAYALRLLRLYSSHERTKRHQAGLFLRKSKIPCCGWIMQDQASLAHRFNADDYLAELVAPNEETRVLLGNAVARLSDKYWTEVNRPKRNRVLYAMSADVGLEEFVRKRMEAVK